MASPSMDIASTPSTFKSESPEPLHMMPLTSSPTASAAAAVVANLSLNSPPPTSYITSSNTSPTNILLFPSPPPPSINHLTYPAAAAAAAGGAIDNMMVDGNARTSNRKRKPSASDDLTLPGDGTGGRGWSKEEDQKLRAAVAAVGPRNWKRISEDYFGRNHTDTQCLNRWYKVLRPGLVKGPWTKEEDDIIFTCMQRGITKWSDIAERIPGRLGKQCRERWLNHLDPSINKGEWTEEEDATLLAAQAKWGNSWTKIAELLPGRSENAVKNRWNSASHTRTRRARLHEVPAPDWNEAYEHQVVAQYCHQFQEGDSLVEFIPWVTGKLQEDSPAYNAVDCVHLSRLHKRLRAILDQETEHCHADSAIYRAVFKKQYKATGSRSSGRPRSIRGLDIDGNRGYSVNNTTTAAATAAAANHSNGLTTTNNESDSLESALAVAMVMMQQQGQQQQAHGAEGADAADRVKVPRDNARQSVTVGGGLVYRPDNDTTAAAAGSGNDHEVGGDRRKRFRRENSISSTAAIRGPVLTSDLSKRRRPIDGDRVDRVVVTNAVGRRAIINEEMLDDDQMEICLAPQQEEEGRMVVDEFRFSRGSNHVRRGRVGRYMGEEATHAQFTAAEEEEKGKQGETGGREREDEGGEFYDDDTISSISALSVEEEDEEDEDDEDNHLMIAKRKPAAVAAAAGSHPTHRQQHHPATITSTPPKNKLSPPHNHRRSGPVYSLTPSSTHHHHPTPTKHNPLPAAATSTKNTRLSPLSSTSSTSSNDFLNHSGMTSLALAVSSLDTSSQKEANQRQQQQPAAITTTTPSLSTPSAPPAAAASSLSTSSPSTNKPTYMRDVISILFSAMRRETDNHRQALYQDALDAATQELPAMVNLVEGVLGGSSSMNFDLGEEGDRKFLLNQILKATQRGVWRGRNTGSSHVNVSAFAAAI